MKLRTWYELADDDRRITSAQMALWLAAAGPVLAFAFIFAEIAMGHPREFASLKMDPLLVLVRCAKIAAYAVAGYLVGERRTAGGVLGLVLFATAAGGSALQGRILTLSVAYAIVGIVLIIRARRALHLPIAMRA